MAKPQPVPAATAFKAASAAGRDWAEVAKACADGLGTLPAGANLGLLYATGELAGDVGSILTFLRERTGIEDWVGTVGMGVAAAFFMPWFTARLVEYTHRLWGDGM